MDAQAQTPREQNLSRLRKLWQDAVADKSDGLDPEPVFKRLESKLYSPVKNKTR